MKQDINELLIRMDLDGSASTFNQSEINLLMEALEYYREIYIG